jgi:CheY-like chemotaxis protein
LTVSTNARSAEGTFVPADGPLAALQQPSATAPSGAQVLHIDGYGLRPDLILGDYQLPMGFTGDEILAELGAILKTRPPTILLTGDIADRHLANAKAMADRILAKPVDVNLLLSEMAALLGRSQ